MTPSAPPLRVVTYNLHSLRDDRQALVAVVRDLAPDVLVLQEAPRLLRWRPRCAALARAFGLVFASGGQPAAGNLILTDMRVAVRHAWSVRFPPDAGRMPRGVALARCEVGGAAFVAAGAHLSTDPAERIGQARLVRQAMTGLDAPAVLGADVNDLPDSAVWRTLTTGLRDPAGGGTGVPGELTFPAAAPRRRIDAVFVDPRIEVTSYRVVDSAPARRASDHLPVVAELRLPEAPGGQDRAGKE
jgi:endonuclease/exonuclease/phosphatase family metal-dependent hydrolase